MSLAVRILRSGSQDAVSWNALCETLVRVRAAHAAARRDHGSLPTAQQCTQSCWLGIDSSQKTPDDQSGVSDRQMSGEFTESEASCLLVVAKPSTKRLKKNCLLRLVGLAGIHAFTRNVARFGRLGFRSVRHGKAISQPFVYQSFCWWTRPLQDGTYLRASKRKAFRGKYLWTFLEIRKQRRSFFPLRVSWRGSKVTELAEKLLDAFDESVHRKWFANVIVDSQHFRIRLMPATFVRGNHDDSHRDGAAAAQFFQN